MDRNFEVNDYGKREYGEVGKSSIGYRCSS
jgi:hypothetical protein